MNASMQWIDEVRGPDSIREVARRVGMNQGTLNRQINLDQLTFETVRDVCRAYERPLIPALIATGHITHEDAGIDRAEAALQSASEQQLVDEVGRRLGLPVPSRVYDLPISEAMGTIHQLRPADRHVGDIEEDLAEVASEPFTLHDEDTDDNY